MTSCVERLHRLSDPSNPRWMTVRSADASASRLSGIQPRRSVRRRRGPRAGRAIRKQRRPDTLGRLKADPAGMSRSEREQGGEDASAAHRIDAMIDRIGTAHFTRIKVTLPIISVQNDFLQNRSTRWRGGNRESRRHAGQCSDDPLAGVGGGTPDAYRRAFERALGIARASSPGRRERVFGRTEFLYGENGGSCRVPFLREKGRRWTSGEI